MKRLSAAAAVVTGMLVAVAGCSGRPTSPATTVGPSVPVVAKSATVDVTCADEGGTDPVVEPQHVRTISTGQTGWFSSPALVDLDHDGTVEIVAPDYSTFVFSAAGERLGAGRSGAGRVYAPAVVADLDGDGTTDIVAGGNDGTVAGYEFRDGALTVKAGWPASTCSAGQCPETRGMAAGDLDNDGTTEVVVTTTNTATDASQVFVFSPDGTGFVPAGAPDGSWPRYNSTDATFNAQGNTGYGAFGENVGIANLDDDPELEIVVTFDNHQINVFEPDGTSVLASDWFTNPASDNKGNRLGWGQMIRWLEPDVEEAHFHAHTGDWPDVEQTPWLQWTASPPSMADLDGDGHAEVIGIPNAEQHEPYVTQGYAFMAFDGAQDGGARSAMRHVGFESPVLSGQPDARGDDWYPPTGIPAPTLVDVDGDGRPDIVSAVPDGTIYAVSSRGTLLWVHDITGGQEETFGSEVVAADLNRDGVPELVLGVYGPTRGSGRLVVLAADGTLLFDMPLPQQAANGNGVGVAAAPTIGDLDGDGTLEIVTSSIDHGLDVFTVPGSGTGCLVWPTGRGSALRAGTAPEPDPS